MRRSFLVVGPLLGLLAVACASPTYSRMRNADERLAELANHSLRDALDLPNAKVEARAHGGVVVLLGEVGTPTERDRAEQAIQGMSGVARVNNMILVVEGASRTAESTAAGGAPFVAARAEPAEAPLSNPPRP